MLMFQHLSVVFRSFDVPRIAQLFALLFIAAWGCSFAAAHPGHSHPKSSPTGTLPAIPATDRTWAAIGGAFRERGMYVMARDGLLQIRRPDDSLVALPIELLGREDQIWIERRRSLIRQIAELNGKISSKKSGEDPLSLPLFAVPPAVNSRDLQLDIEVPDAQWLLAQLEPNGQRDGQKEGEGAKVSPEKIPEIAQAFQAFVKLKAIKTRWDERYFYVESKGLPDHRMMVGITAWQQQVPLPQNYTGHNAWQIPLHPVPAKNPQSTKDKFLRGAIALAVNGIPIFNPLNNRGDDAFLFGELDEFGGHCGRADDYHYHLAPVHLQKTVGPGLPIAYALDGYPI